jgi:hypothetical protein
MTGIKTPRPRLHLEETGRFYRNAWRLVDQYRADRGKSLPDWPDWCFLPLAGAYAIVSEGTGTDRMPPAKILDVARVGAHAAWRVTQGIYRIDPDLYAALIDTPVTGDLPCDVFYRLPEWCVYVETPGLEWGAARLYGYWAHLEWDANNGSQELRLLLDTEGALLPMPLHLVQGGLDESLDAAIREARYRSSAAGFSGHWPEPHALRPAIEPLISLLLYLCAANSEIGDGSKSPEKPQPKRTKRGWRLFPADKPATWDVGARIGAALRKASTTSEPDGGTHAGPRPHIRRAHWHTFLVGADRQTRRLRWLPPIPVNLDAIEDLPATIKPVRG